MPESGRSIAMGVRVGAIWASDRHGKPHVLRMGLLTAVPPPFSRESSFPSPSAGRSGTGTDVHGDRRLVPNALNRCVQSAVYVGPRARLRGRPRLGSLVRGSPLVPRQLLLPVGDNYSCRLPPIVEVPPRRPARGWFVGMCRRDTGRAHTVTRTSLSATRSDRRCPG